MKNLALDPVTNDLIKVRGNLVINSGVDQIAQRCQTELQMFAGEWFLDTTQGVPYRQQILVKNPNLDVIQAVLMKKVLDVPGVTDIVNFKYGYDRRARALSIAVQVKTTNGQVITIKATIGAPGGGQ